MFAAYNNVNVKHVQIKVTSQARDQFRQAELFQYFTPSCMIKKMSFTVFL